MPVLIEVAIKLGGGFRKIVDIFKVLTFSRQHLNNFPDLLTYLKRIP